MVFWPLPRHVDPCQTMPQEKLPMRRDANFDVFAVSPSTHRASDDTRKPRCSTGPFSTAENPRFGVVVQKRPDFFSCRIHAAFSLTSSREMYCRPHKLRSKDE